MPASSRPTRQPSSQPSGKPSGQPTIQPSLQPTSQPSDQPSRQPSSQPTRQPTGQPSRQPSRQPSSQPSRQPSSQPTVQPSSQPSCQPSRQPSLQPSMQPSTQPSSVPSLNTNTTLELAFTAVNVSKVFVATVSHESLIVSVQLLRSGSKVFCGAYVTISSINGSVTVVNRPSAAAAIAAQGFASPASTRTVDVVVTGLIASTNYTVYCTVQSVLGENFAPIENAYATAFSVTTSCCRQITVEAANGVRTTMAGGTLLDGMLITLGSAPTTSLVLTLVLQRQNSSLQQTTHVSLAPSTFTVTSSTINVAFISTIVVNATAFGVYYPRVVFADKKTDKALLSLLT